MAIDDLSDESKNEWEKLLNPETFIRRLDSRDSGLISYFLMYSKEIKSEEEMQKIIEELIRRIAKSFNVEIKNVRFANLSQGSVAGLTRDGEQIIFNKNSIEKLGDEFNSLEIFHAIVHELRHAFQQKVICNLVGSDELRDEFRKGFKEYVQPSNKIIDNADYTLNICEVDAERFSFGYIESFLGKENGRSFDYIYDSLTNRLIEENKKAEKLFNERVKNSEIARFGSDKIVEIVKKFISDTKIILNSEVSEENAELSKKIFDDFMIVKNSELYFHLIKMSDGDLWDYILKNIFEKEDFMNFVDRIDYPVFQGLKKVANGNYSGNPIERVQEGIGKCVRFLKKNDIQFKENDNADIVSKFKEFAPKIYLRNLQDVYLKTPANKRMNKEILHQMSEIREIDSVFSKFGVKIKDLCVNYAIENIDSNDMKKIRKGYSDRKVWEKVDKCETEPVFAFFDLSMKYSSMEEFLKFAGVKATGNVYKKYVETLPKYIVSLMFKTNLNDDELDFIKKYNSEIRKLEVSKLRRLLQSGLNKYKFNKLLSSPNKNNPMIAILEQAGITLEELAKPVASDSKKISANGE